VPEGIKVFSDSFFVDPFFFLNLREVNHPNSDIELPVPVGAFFLALLPRPSAAGTKTAGIRGN
jgi:hypothetical protein